MSAKAADAVKAVFDGAEVAVDLSFVDETWEDPAPVTRAELVKSVKLCRRCDLGVDGHRKILPSVSGRATFAVVSERMTAGQQGWLDNVIRTDWGEAEADELTIAWCNVVGCATDPTPPIRAQARCRPWLLDQLDVADTRFVLLVGGVALRAWRSDFTLQGHAGRVGIWGYDPETTAGGWVVMAVPHPATVLMAKGREKKQGIEDLRGWLQVWKRVVAGDVLEHLPRTCSKPSCAQDTITYVDVDGQPWCATHEQVGRGMWRAVRDGWVDRAEVPASVAVELPMELDA